MAPPSCSGVGHSSTTTTTLSMASPSSGGIESSASATICSNWSRVTVTAIGTFCLLISARRVRTMRGPVRAGTATESNGTTPGTRGSRSHAARTESRGAPGNGSAGGVFGRRGRSARGRRPQGFREWPRGDPSCNAAETTRGLPLSPAPSLAALPPTSTGRVPVPCRTPPVPCTGWTTTCSRSRRAPTRRGHRAAPRRSRSSRGAGSGKTRVLTRRIAWQAREGADRPAPRPRGHVHAQGRGRARRRLGRLGVDARGHRRHVPRHRARAAAPPRRRRAAHDARRCSSARCALLVPLVSVRGREAGLARRRARRPRSSGPRRGSCAPTGYERGGHASRRARPRARPPKSPTSTARTSARSGAAASSTSTTSSAGCADALERDADFAAAQRWRFRHLFVDEFQDASPAQFRLLRAWLGDRSDLCVVGDGDQAIYGFAGADPDFLVRFTAQFPPERFPDVGVVRLGSNYRSTPQVVAAAGAVLGPARRRTAQCARRGPTAPRPSSPTYDTDDAEARGVARSGARRARRRSCRGRASPCSTA